MSAVPLMVDMTFTPEAYARLEAMADESDRFFEDLEARAARIDVSDINRLRRLRRRAERFGLWIDKGKGRGWNPMLSRGARDREDLGGLMVYEVLHILAPSYCPVDPHAVKWGNDYDLNFDDVEEIIADFDARHAPIDAEHMKYVKIAKKLGGFGR